MSTKDIRTYHAHTTCDVCGRTLLRGERAETYINGGARREVCELCKSRALHEGWVREGTLPEYGESTLGSERRRSLLGRLRSRRERSPGAPTLDDELGGSPNGDLLGGSTGARSTGSDPADRPRRRRPPERGAAPRRRPRERPQEAPEPREPRHVRAVPSSDDQKILAAADLFNASEHRRTVAGVARSLGAPAVRISPSTERPSLVQIVVSWELCWYRYTVDLSDGVPAVRVDGQGYELGELTELERTPNAMAEESGGLLLG